MGGGAQRVEMGSAGLPPVCFRRWCAGDRAGPQWIAAAGSNCAGRGVAALLSELGRYHDRARPVLYWAGLGGAPLASLAETAAKFGVTGRAVGRRIQWVAWAGARLPLRAELEREVTWPSRNDGDHRAKTRSARLLGLANRLLRCLGQGRGLVGGRRDAGQGRSAAAPQAVNVKTDADRDSGQNQAEAAGGMGGHGVLLVRPRRVARSMTYICAAPGMVDDQEGRRADSIGRFSVGDQYRSQVRSWATLSCSPRPFG